MTATEADQIIHADRAFYCGSAPCVFHKRDGRPCPRCPDYAPMGLKILIVKQGAMGDVLRATAIPLVLLMQILSLAWRGKKLEFLARCIDIDQPANPQARTRRLLERQFTWMEQLAVVWSVPLF